MLLLVLLLLPLLGVLMGFQISNFTRILHDGQSFSRSSSNIFDHLPTYRSDLVLHFGKILNDKFANVKLAPRRHTEAKRVQHKLLHIFLNLLKLR